MVIVGGLPIDIDRASLLAALAERHGAIAWEWITPINPQFLLAEKPLNRLLHELRTKPPDDETVPVVVKLRHLNGRHANALYVNGHEPILAPSELAALDDLVEWLLSPSAAIIPPNSWSRPVREAALLAVLSKLVRNKSWNKDRHGHAWTKEDDLFGQAPVSRPDQPKLYSEAMQCVARATGSLLITKGGSQGKTRKEWCINTAYLPLVKRALLERGVEALRESPDLAALLEYVGNGPDELIEIDKVIISERVLVVCRDRE